MPAQVPPTLSDLAARVGGTVDGDGEVRVRDLTHDSREAGPGTAFACRPGRTADGHDFAETAVAAGAPALVVERVLDVAAPQLRVASVAEALGDLAAAVHGDPSGELLLLGVTGTNGKTTATFLLESVLAAAGHETGLVGTVETRVRGRTVPGLRTTPESTDLQRLLRRMRDEGVSAAAMEVSSHGLALGRVRGTRFATAGFTNLSRDHLDFHRDLEDYFDAKAALFTPAYAASAVVCVDDAYGRRLAREATIPVVRLATPLADEPGVEPDVTCADLELAPEGSRFTAHLRGGSRTVEVRLPGVFNVTNALLALALAEDADIDLDAAVSGVAALPGVPGRMERVEAGQPFTVLVDYAHTPDSVTGVLAAARDLAAAPDLAAARELAGDATGGGRVIGVLGCGGDRDREKRPLMGRALAEGADVAVLTSDNPRSEDPEAILEAMAAGARDSGRDGWEVVPDRRAAIARAVGEARRGDVVVIAGKGHETGQEVAGTVHPFDDREEARAALGARRTCEGDPQ